MNDLSDARIDRHNAVRPFVVVKAIHSPHCGWMPAVHDSFDSERSAVKEANVILRLKCPYCRVEKWPDHNRDGGEQVVQEFGINPGIDEAIDSLDEIAAIAMREWWADRKGAMA